MRRFIGLVLNRLYIVVGVIAILLLAAAFVVPSFIPWGQYRDRLAAIAGEVLGTPVRIEGDVAFSLLPQPKLTFSNVSAGPAAAPHLTVERVEADFSLIDFLRDRYNVTRLRLDGPTVSIEIAADGSVDTGIGLARTVTSNISVADAVVVGGTVKVHDERARETYIASAVAGELKLEALRGPFSFQGTGNVDGAVYALRITTGQLDADGGGPLAMSLRPADERFTLAADGHLTPGVTPRFSGTMTYRQPPQKPAKEGAEDAGQGDLVISSKLEASPSKVLLSDYVVIPDENRAATRLLGAADVTLGSGMAFNAVISGGLLALPPRDATAEQAVEPYELIRLLRELPLPAAPGIPGTIGVDVAELNLRSFALRNVRLDARAHEGGWTVSGLTGTLPGDTRVSVTGAVTIETGRPEFSGTLSLKSQRLDALTTLWRKPAQGNPLFGMPGSIEAKVDLVGETLSVSDGRVELDGEACTFSAQLGLGASPDLHITADMGQLDPARSAALFALLPDLAADASFAASFPKGEFELIADSMTLGGLNGRALSARGSWDGGVLVVDDISAGDLGGASIKAALTAFGSITKPELSGSGTLTVASADAPALASFYKAIGASSAIEGFLTPSLPADLALRLDAPSGDGAQSLAISGRLGSAEVSVDAELQAGFLRALSGPVKVRLDMKSADAAAMTAQLGLGDASLFVEGEPVHLVGVIDGNIANSLETTVLVEGGGDSLGFSGNVVVTDPAAYSGKGTIKAALADPSAFAEWLGAGGISLPAISASARVDFNGSSDVQLLDITGSSGGEEFAGSLRLATRGSTRAVAGAITAGRVDIGGLLRTLTGPASLLAGSGTWPDGPLATGDQPRSTTGRVAITAPSVAAAGKPLLTDLSLELDWDATTTRLRNLTGKLGGGSLGLELAVCCAGPLPDKQVTGRIALAGIPLDSIVPPLVADALDGTLDASGRFDGTGGSVAGILAALTGEGTYGVTGLRIERLDPRAATMVADVENLLKMQPEELSALIEERLDDAPFTSPQMSGSFTVAGGVLRSPNVPIEGDGGQLFGSGSIRLADLGLNGDYTLSPTAITPAALVDAGTARISTRITGSLLAPERQFDVSSLVDAIMVKAYETEVARLEKLREEDEARRKAEEAEKARVAAEAAAIRAADEAAAQKAAAEAAAQKAAEEAAAKQAADEEAARKAREEEELRRALEEFNKPMDIGLGN